MRKNNIKIIEETKYGDEMRKSIADQFKHQRLVINIMAIAVICNSVAVICMLIATNIH